jgi:hypothetical protein
MIPSPPPPPFFMPSTFGHLQDPRDARIQHLEQENQKLLDTLETLTKKYMNLLEQQPPPPPQKKLHVISKPNQATILTTKRIRP